MNALVDGALVPVPGGVLIRDGEGTLIGLNLAKTLVEMHGGTVKVESRKGVGSTFTIRLPIGGPPLTEQAEIKVA